MFYNFGTLKAKFLRGGKERDYPPGRREGRGGGQTGEKAPASETTDPGKRAERWRPAKREKHPVFPQPRPNRTDPAVRRRKRRRVEGK